MKEIYKHLSPARRITLFFALTILIGSCLLSLPVMQQQQSTATYLDHLFTTVSMVCVTGLSTQAVANTYNLFGQVICIVLMQIGGLGVLSFLGLFYLDVTKKFRLLDKTTLQESLNREDARGFKDFMKAVFAFTFAIEGIGALLLSTRLVPLLGWSKGLFSAIFLAISAFCNAGFDNLGSNSLQNFPTDVLLNLTIAGLIIMGGIGFSVWFDLRTQFTDRKGVRHLRFHTKVVLGLTAFILSAGTLLSLWTEFHNPATIGHLPLGQKILVSFFQTVSMRTAGFASIDYTKAKPITLLIYITQMMMGGAPGGTAGGIKITTLLVGILFVRSQILGLPHPNFRKRSIDFELAQKALAITSVFSGTFLLGLLFLTALEPKLDFLHLVFETMSALATVGVSANVTGQLHPASLFIVMGLMFAGRIGPITIITGLNRRKISKKQALHYAKADVLVG